MPAVSAAGRAACPLAAVSSPFNARTARISSSTVAVDAMRLARNSVISINVLTLSTYRSLSSIAASSSQIRKTRPASTPSACFFKTSICSGVASRDFVSGPSACKTTRLRKCPSNSPASRRKFLPAESKDSTAASMLAASPRKIAPARDSSSVRPTSPNTPRASFSVMLPSVNEMSWSRDDKASRMPPSAPRAMARRASVSALIFSFSQTYLSRAVMSRVWMRRRSKR